MQVIPALSEAEHIYLSSVANKRKYAYIAWRQLSSLKLVSDLA
ncbi:MULTISPECIES: hypothetical protein [unclassified Pseudomonas]|nr:hypothetical protein [Pseudomonas sp.]